MTQSNDPAPMAVEELTDEGHRVVPAEDFHRAAAALSNLATPAMTKMSDEHGYDDYDDFEQGCYECGGEGFVSDCVEEWACVDPEYGCDYCTRRCPLCSPPKPNSSTPIDGGEHE